MNYPDKNQLIVLSCLFPFFQVSLTTCSSREKKTEDSNKQRLPDIIIIVSDDQGYNDLGCYGREDIKTPNLDRIAENGVRFTSFYVACSVCTPSRSALLTGRYPQRNGTYDLFRNDMVDFGYQYTPYEYSISPERVLGMDEREVLISRLLRDKGYRTGIFGKWDLGQLKRFLPQQKGFDRFYGFANTGIDYFTHERYGVPSMYSGNSPTTEDKGTYCTYLFEREAIKFLENTGDQPFFLYLPFNAPHSASNLDKEIRIAAQAPPEYLMKYADEKNERRKRYMASVTCMDDAIGNIMKYLRDKGREGNTLVIFLSDNGGGTGSNNKPLKGGKNTFWEGGLRVPCIISWPERIRKNLVLDNFITSLEIFPTILAAAKVKKPDSLIIDGFDILPLLTGEGNPERKEMYWEFAGGCAVRSGNLKWIKSDKANGLYDLSNDIEEINDLSAVRKNEYNALENSFRKWQKEMAEADPRGPFRDY